MNVLARALAPWANPAPLTGILAFDVERYLGAFGCDATAAHCAAVAVESRDLADRFGVDPVRAEAAGWLHDISAVVPSGQRLGLALTLGVDVLPEEREAPMILHQKLSAVLAKATFGVSDSAVLDAVRYHTTLHPDADTLAKVVFVADKVRWDQSGDPPYLVEVTRALTARSLDAAVCVYLDYLWGRRATLRVVHPWMAAARRALCETSGGGP